jgi:hypothetical protein
VALVQLPANAINVIRQLEGKAVAQGAFANLMLMLVRAAPGVVGHG